MFRQVCIIEPSFFKTTSGMHRRPFDVRHLVYYYRFFQTSLKMLTHSSSTMCSKCPRFFGFLVFTFFLKILHNLSIGFKSTLIKLHQFTHHPFTIYLQVHLPSTGCICFPSYSFLRTKVPSTLYGHARTLQYCQTSGH